MTQCAVKLCLAPTRPDTHTPVPLDFCRLWQAVEEATAAGPGHKAHPQAAAAGKLLDAWARQLSPLTAAAADTGGGPEYLSELLLDELRSRGLGQLPQCSVVARAAAFEQQHAAAVPAAAGRPQRDQQPAGPVVQKMVVAAPVAPASAPCSGDALEAADAPQAAAAKQTAPASAADSTLAPHAAGAARAADHAPLNLPAPGPHLVQRTTAVC